MNGNPNCIENNCPGELYACYTGTNTCSQLSACAQMCMGDQVCEADCFFESSGLAQAQLGALQDCAGANMCMDDACVAENCNNELQSCVGGGSDVLPCPIIAECLIDCGGDAACEQTCVPSTPEAAMEAAALDACADMQNCNDIGCTEQACPAEWGACHSGTAVCADIWACVLGCNDAELCQFNCVFEGSFMDQVLFGALADCALMNMCEDENCINQNCGVQALACGI
jgi:hypothetical protein